jgi:hypothetical protein
MDMTHQFRLRRFARRGSLMGGVAMALLVAGFAGAARRRPGVAVVWPRRANSHANRRFGDRHQRRSAGSVGLRDARRCRRIRLLSVAPSTFRLGRLPEQGRRQDNSDLAVPDLKVRRDRGQLSRTGPAVENSVVYIGDQNRVT